MEIAISNFANLDFSSFLGKGTTASTPCVRGNHQISLPANILMYDVSFVEHGMQLSRLYFIGQVLISYNAVQINHGTMPERSYLDVEYFPEFLSDATSVAAEREY